jgi:hypothetical protein
MPVLHGRLAERTHAITHRFDTGHGSAGCKLGTADTSAAIPAEMPTATFNT